ncbi:MAG: hypothetical protein AB7R69_01310 [Candidatus Babeliales bacterium]
MKNLLSLILTALLLSGNLSAMEDFQSIGSGDSRHQDNQNSHQSNDDQVPDFTETQGLPVQFSVSAECAQALLSLDPQKDFVINREEENNYFIEQGAVATLLSNFAERLKKQNELAIDQFLRGQQIEDTPTNYILLEILNEQTRRAVEKEIKNPGSIAGFKDIRSVAELEVLAHATGKSTNYPLVNQNLTGDIDEYYKNLYQECALSNEENVLSEQKNRWLTSVLKNQGQNDLGQVDPRVMDLFNTILPKVTNAHLGGTENQALTEFANQVEKKLNVVIVRKSETSDQDKQSMQPITDSNKITISFTRPGKKAMYTFGLGAFLGTAYLLKAYVFNN